jgi:hypothetical protein
MAQALGIVRVLVVSGDSAVDGLAEELEEVMADVLARARLLEQHAGHQGRLDCPVQFGEGEKSGVGSDGRTGEIGQMKNPGRMGWGDPTGPFYLGESSSCRSVDDPCFARTKKGAVLQPDTDLRRAPSWRRKSSAIALQLLPLNGCQRMKMVKSPADFRCCDR